jgi:hypothetical protein
MKDCCEQKVEIGNWITVVSASTRFENTFLFGKVRKISKSSECVKAYFLESPRETSMWWSHAEILKITGDLVHTLEMQHGALLTAKILAGSNV